MARGGGGGAIVLALGFGGGFLTARGLEGGERSSEGGASALSRSPGAFKWALFGKPRGADAERPAPPKPEGFAVWRNRVDTSRPEPRACVELSRPLDPERSYGQFVQVNPDPGAPPAVSVQGAEICVAGLGFTDRRITLLKGLPAKDGSVLAANADVDFSFGEKPPFVGFVGDGVILPRSSRTGWGSRRSTSPSCRSRSGAWWTATWPASRWSPPTRPQRASTRTTTATRARTTRAARSGPARWPCGARRASGRRRCSRWGGAARVRPGAYVVKARDASGGRGLKAGEGRARPTTRTRRRRRGAGCCSPTWR
jgi:hypothetical protein